MKSVSTILGLLLVDVATSFLSWVNIASGSKTHLFSLNHLPLLGIFNGILILIAATFIFMSGLRPDQPIWRKVAFIPLGALLVGSLGTLVIADCVGSLIPHVFLPGNFHKLFLALSAGPGAWISAISILTAILLNARKFPTLDSLQGFRMTAYSRIKRAPSQVTMVLVIIAVFSARFSSLFIVSINGIGTPLASWLLPWVGGFSLIGILLLTASLIIRHFMPCTGALLFVATSWCYFFGSILIFGFGRSLAALSSRQYFGQSAPNLHVTFSSGFYLFLAASVVGLLASLWDLSLTGEVAN